MTDCDDITPRQLESWHLVPMQTLNARTRLRMLEWMCEQPGGKFYWTLGGNFWFELESDAVWVLLNWK